MTVDFSDAGEANDAIDKTLMELKRDGARRSEDALNAIFKEMTKAVTVLSQNPVLRGDIEFEMHVRRLIGVENMDVFNERVTTLETYVKRVAEAHGVSAAVLDGDAVRTSKMTHSHSEQNDENADPRLRLAVR